MSHCRLDIHGNFVHIKLFIYLPNGSPCTNLPFDEWTEVFSSERLTGGLLDRPTHHVHILEMNGESYRLKQ